MKLTDFPLFIDENIYRQIVEHLRSKGFDVKSVVEEGLIGKKDIELIPIAQKEGRVIVTRDSDFGQIVFTQNVDYTGIIYLRPGHFPPDFHIETVNAILELNPDLKIPFTITAFNKNNSIRIKIRS